MEAYNSNDWSGRKRGLESLDEKPVNQEDLYEGRPRRGVELDDGYRWTKEGSPVTGCNYDRWDTSRVTPVLTSTNHDARCVSRRLRPRFSNSGDSLKADGKSKIMYVYAPAIAQRCCSNRMIYTFDASLDTLHSFHHSIKLSARNNKFFA